MLSSSFSLKTGAAGPTETLGPLSAILYSATPRTYCSLFSHPENLKSHTFHFGNQTKPQIWFEGELLECRPSKPVMHKQPWSTKGINNVPREILC
jgi:hypothetical protein